MTEGKSSDKNNYIKGGFLPERWTQGQHCNFPELRQQGEGIIQRTHMWHRK